jgi:AcrR family transcriptional regulator
MASPHESRTSGRAGRPRDQQAAARLRAAARQLTLERGYAAVTIADIAAAAGSGRQAIYRRWPGKAELVLDAFTEHAVSEVDTAGIPDLAQFLIRTFRALAATGPALRGLMAYAQHDPEFRIQLRDRFIAPRREALRAQLESGPDPVPDPDAAIAAIYGALWYRLLLDEPLDDEFAVRLSQVLTGHPGPARPPSGS